MKKTEQEQFFRTINTGFLIIGLFFIFQFCCGLFNWGTLDDTDSPDGKRSGMILRTDYGTGIQYLESTQGCLIRRELK